MGALEELAKWMEHSVERHGVIKTLFGPIAILGALSALGVSLTDASGHAVPVSVATCTTITTISALMIRIRALRANVSSKSSALAHYSKVLETHSTLQFEIVEWNKQIAIGRNGDAVMEKRIRIRPLSSELLFCWTTATSFGDELCQSGRGEVSHEVRWMSETGDLGSRIATTERWDGNRNIVYAHFDESLRPSHDAYLYFRWVWPRYSPLVSDSSPERFSWHFRRPCHDMDATVKILPAAKLKGEIRVAALNGLPKPTVSTNPDGSRIVRFVVVDPPSNCHFGFILDAN